MKKYIILLLIFKVSFSNGAQLVEHVKNSIKHAQELRSDITKEILDIPGMSSPKIRHLLNNLCKLPNTNYLEVGTWQGSTFVSALYNNHDYISSAVAIDNWSEFATGNPEVNFHLNTSRFLNKNRFAFYNQNSFSVDKKNLKLSGPVNIYFYDGDHSAQSQKAAFTYFNDILADTFIAIVDDFNWSAVQKGTKDAFEELNYQVLYEIFLPAVYKDSGDLQNWWNGLYVGVIKKNK